MTLINCHLPPVNNTTFDVPNPKPELQVALDVFDNFEKWLATFDNAEEVTVLRERMIGAIEGKNNWLNLSKLNLTKVPSLAFALKGLTSLYLGHNQLKQVPNEVCTLTELRTLHLQCNNLSVLPPDFGDLTKLTSLNIYLNPRLIKIPESVMKIPLKWFYIDGTGITKEEYQRIITSCQAVAALNIQQ